MGTELVPIAPLPVPATVNPTPAWPAWLTAMERSLRQDPRTGNTEDRRILATLPTPSQRLAIEKHRDQCAALLARTPLNDEDCRKRTFGHIAKLMLAKPSRVGGPETTEARGETYVIALDDVPTWAVEAAIRKWHRGEHDRHPQTFDYRWAPESADLRKLALREVSGVRKRILTIENILGAAQG